jgi:hypothetical protein
VTFEARCVCDGPYHISEYTNEGEGQREHDCDRGCQMEHSRLLGRELSPWSTAGVDQTHDSILDYVWHRWSDSYLQDMDNAPCCILT